MLDAREAANAVESIIDTVPSNQLDQLTDEIVGLLDLEEFRAELISKHIDEIIDKAKLETKDSGIKAIAREFDLISAQGLRNAVTKRLENPE